MYGENTKTLAILLYSVLVSWFATHQSPSGSYTAYYHISVDITVV